MGSFCSNCGAALPGANPFCTRCGARQAATPSQPPFQQQGIQPTSGPAKKGSGIKILVVVVAFVVLAGITVIGGLYYAAHKLKDVVVEKAANAGVDLNSISSTAGSNSATIRDYKACDLLPKAQASALLGEPIERIEDQGATCIYYGPPGLSAKLAQQGTADFMKKVQQPGSKVDGNDAADALSKLMGGLAAQAGAAGAGGGADKNGDVPLLMFVIDGDGKPQMAALTASKAIFSGIAKGATDGAQGFGTDIPNLGDRAVRLANLGLNVLQGNTLVRLMPGPVPDANDKAIAIARTILPKL